MQMMMIFQLVSVYEIKRKSLMIIWDTKEINKGMIIIKMMEWIYSNSSNRFRQFNTGRQLVRELRINEKLAL